MLSECEQEQNMRREMRSGWRIRIRGGGRRREMERSYEVKNMDMYSFRTEWMTGTCFCLFIHPSNEMMGICWRLCTLTSSNYGGKNSQKLSTSNLECPAGLKLQSMQTQKKILGPTGIRTYLFVHHRWGGGWGNQCRDAETLCELFKVYRSRPIKAGGLGRTLLWIRHANVFSHAWIKNNKVILTAATSLQKRFHAWQTQLSSLKRYDRTGVSHDYVEPCWSIMKVVWRQSDGCRVKMFDIYSREGKTWAPFLCLSA